VTVAASEDLYLSAEYAVERLGKRDYNKVVGDYFGAKGKPDMGQFMRSIGFNLDRLDPRRMAAEQLYTLLCRDLYVTDWSSPSKAFLTEDLYNLGVEYLSAAPAAIEQCVHYGGRHWAYFRTVVSQAVAVQQVEDAMDAEAQAAMKLPPDYFERLGQPGPPPNLSAVRDALASHLEDKRMEQANAEKD